MIRINQIKLTLKESKTSIINKVTTKLSIKTSDIKKLQIYKESIDARKGRSINKVYTVDILVDEMLEEKILKANISDVLKIEPYTYVSPKHGSKPMHGRPIVVGFGPAGMMAALLLAEEGYRPIIIERGSKVEDRVKKVEEFWEKGILDPKCNVQFGEGGAGTFSDGKLTTRVKDDRILKVMDELIEAGAKDEIRYVAHPHIGTDQLRIIVKNIREKIIRLGGTFHFDTLVEDIVVENNQVVGVITGKGLMKTKHVVLAIGHSARDTFHALHSHNIQMEPKPFAIGVRVEHKQSMINKNQYGDEALAKDLGAAEYFLTHTASNKRGVYSFCMCPGGVVVPSTSIENGIVVNGMSYSKRDSENSNSAILVQVGPDDYGNGVLDGIKFQEDIERKAFVLGGSNYKAPAQLISDYLNHTPSTKLGNVKPSYALGVTLTDIHEVFPKAVNVALHEGFENFEKKIPGFKTGIMTGVETRSSSPLRINRNNETMESLSIKGIYPCGEGCGYAGGIMSAAIDGIRVSEAIIKAYYKKEKN
ncbi:MAG: FAD-dependent monooxygenase [Erysipelotrichales bacterium]|nr:FAD-dependent monooxygenase [Erysipelotrichales bacterium]